MKREGTISPASKYSLQLIRNSIAPTNTRKEKQLPNFEYFENLQLNVGSNPGSVRSSLDRQKFKIQGSSHQIIFNPELHDEQWKVVKTKTGIRFQMKNNTRPLEKNASSDGSGINIWTAWKKAPEEQRIGKLPEIVHSARTQNRSIEKQYSKVFSKQGLEFGQTYPLKGTPPLKKYSPSKLGSKLPDTRDINNSKSILNLAKQKILYEDNSLRADISRKMLAGLLQSYDPATRQQMTKVTEETERNSNIYQRAPRRVSMQRDPVHRKSSKALLQHIQGSMSQEKFKSIQQAFAKRVDISPSRKEQSSKSLTRSIERRGRSVEEQKEEINKMVSQAIGQANQNQAFTLVEGAREKLEILTMQMRKMHQAEERQTFGHTEVVKKESTKHFDALVSKHRSEMDEKKYRDGIKRKRWMIAQEILNVLLALKSMKISPRMALEKKVFPKSPFEHKNAYNFIKAVKRGAFEEVKSFLQEQSYLVHDFDYVHQTGAHWAAKRNNTTILRVLLENGANPNAQDMGGRTPLFLASKLGCLACVKLLLAFKAKPNIKAHSGQNSLDVAFNYKVKSFLMKARSLQIFLQFAPKQDRLKAWQSEGLKFFEEQSLEEMSEFVR